MVKKQKAVDSVIRADQPQPGQVIAPGGSEIPKPQTQLSPVETPALSSDPVSAAKSETEESPSPQTDENMGSKAVADGQTVRWTASEFIAHEKSAGWYGGLAAVTVVLGGAIFLITKDFISCAVVVVCAVTFGVYAGRKPRELSYSLDQTGVTIGAKHYGYTDFRCFSVNHEGAFASLDFMPLKRFLPVLTVYYPPADEPVIMSALSGRLPYQEPRHDAVERLLKRIRF